MLTWSSFWHSSRIWRQRLFARLQKITLSCMMCYFGYKFFINISFNKFTTFGCRKFRCMWNLQLQRLSNLCQSLHCKKLFKKLRSLCTGIEKCKLNAKHLILYLQRLGSFPVDGVGCVWVGKNELDSISNNKIMWFLVVNLTQKQTCSHTIIKDSYFGQSMRYNTVHRRNCKLVFFARSPSQSLRTNFESV